jgi:hypothetical protein
MIAALEGLVCDVLPDEDAGGQQDGFQRQNDRQQWEGIFVKPPSVRGRLCIDPQPKRHTKTLDDEEIRRSNEAANGMQHAMMEQELLLIVFFNSEDLLNVTGGGPGRVARF